jgi:hypothetical protein
MGFSYKFYIKLEAVNFCGVFSIFSGLFNLKFFIIENLFFNLEELILRFEFR